MMGTSPPGPLRWGSTTCNVKAVATPASKALPPFSRVAMPTAVAIQWVVVTTPKVPSISGLVVNGFGLILPIKCVQPIGARRAPGREDSTGTSSQLPPPRKRRVPKQALKVGLAGLGAVGLDVGR